MRASRKKPTRKIAPVIAARLNGQFSLQMQADGNIAASLGDYSVSLGQFSAAAMDRARNLTTGLPLTSFAGKSAVAREVDVLVHRLARQGLLEYRLSSPRDEQDLVVIEPQVAEYWPQRAKLGERRYRRAVALCLSAPARQRDGAGIAARRRAVSDWRSRHRRHPRRAVAAAQDQQASPPRGLLQPRSARTAAGQPDPAQARCEKRRRPSGE